MSLFLPSIEGSSIASFELKAPKGPPIHGEFDPASAHLASIIPLRDMSDFTEKVVQKRLDEIHPASIHLPTQLVRDGYGELVLRIKEAATLRPVTKEEYAAAYRIFQKYAPRLEEHPRPLTKSRIEMMREELRGINPNMVATFIPRTLYELMYIRKSIEEDIQRERHFPFKDPEKPTKEEIQALKVRCSQNSWFLDPKGEKSRGGIFPKIEISVPADVVEHLPTLIDIGYRLNLAAVQEIDRIGTIIEDLSVHQIQELIDDHLRFIERFSKDPALIAHFSKVPENIAPLSGFFINFSSEKIKSDFLEKVVRSDEKMKALKKIALIECQESMADKVLCYRGGHLRTDSPTRAGSEGEVPYSISFGSACFPGIVVDSGACAYCHMFNWWFGDKDDAYLLVLDPAKESSQTFYTPSFTALESLFGDGETWHYRFKNSKDDPRDVNGITLKGRGFAPGSSDSEKLAIIKSPLSVKQTKDKFEDLKKHNVILIYHHQI